MNIIQPRNRTGMPPDKEVRWVLQQLCYICELDPELLTVYIVAGARKQGQTKVGIQLIERHPGPGKTALSYIFYCQSEGFEARMDYGLRGQKLNDADLWNTINKVCIKNFLSFERQTTGAAPLTKLKTFPNPVITFPPPPKIPDKTFVDTVRTLPAAKVPEPEQSINDSEDKRFMAKKNRELEQNEQNLGNKPDDAERVRWFEDPSKIHGIVASLVGKFKLNQPFGMLEFRTVLADVLGQVTSKAVELSALRVLKARGLLMRLNPDKTFPSLFGVTESAIRFASGPIPEKSPERQSKILSLSRSKNPRLSVSETAALLKEKDQEYRTLSFQISETEAFLKEQESRTQSKEIIALKHEIKSFEEELASLRAKLSALGIDEDKIARKKAELERFKEQISDPELLRCHEEFETLKKLFS